MQYNTNVNSSNLTKKKKQVVVGLSGGVDSAVTAHLLLQQGFEVIGVALSLWKVSSPYPEEDSSAQARDVAEALDIPLHVLDVQERFYQQVVEPFVDAYARGQTPNPCVICNPTFKFARLLEIADAVKAHWIATGHYARVVHSPGGPSRLLRARYLEKDQSYALYRLNQRHLKRLLLPLGEVESKAFVRQIAKQQGLPGMAQRDSQDLCFMRGGDYRELLGALRPAMMRPGPIYNEAGEVLGEHQGLPRYTIGQRGGLGIAAKEKLYVLRLVPQTNALIVGPKSSLARRMCTITTLSFVAGSPPASTFSASGRIRYRMPSTPVRLQILDDDCADVQFEVPQFGIAPGQSLVLYQEDSVIGGGVISD